MQAWPVMMPKKAAEGNTQPGQLAKDTFYDFDLLTLKSNVPLQLPMINYDIIVVPKILNPSEKIENFLNVIQYYLDF